MGAGLGRRVLPGQPGSSPHHSPDATFLLKLKCCLTRGEFGLVATIAGASPEKIHCSNCRACCDPPPNHPHNASGIASPAEIAHCTRQTSPRIFMNFSFFPFRQVLLLAAWCIAVRMLEPLELERAVLLQEHPLAYLYVERVSNLTLPAAALFHLVPSLIPAATHPTDPPVRPLPPTRRPEASQIILFEMRARAPAGGLADGAAAASSGLGCRAPAAAAVVRRPLRIDLCVPLVPSQVVGLRLPARHGRWATLRHSRGRQQRGWRRRRRRGGVPTAAERFSVVMYVC